MPTGPTHENGQECGAEAVAEAEPLAKAEALAVGRPADKGAAADGSAAQDTGEPPQESGVASGPPEEDAMNEDGAMDALRMAELELEQIMEEQRKAEEEQRSKADLQQASPELARAMQRRRKQVDEKGEQFLSPRPKFY